MPASPPPDPAGVIVTIPIPTAQGPARTTLSIQRIDGRPVLVQVLDLPVGLRASGRSLVDLVNRCLEAGVPPADLAALLRGQREDATPVLWPQGQCFVLSLPDALGMMLEEEHGE